MPETRVDPSFEQLLEFVRASRGFDYSGYKRPSLTRRFRRRMDAVGAQSYGDYRAYLEANPDEFGELFDTILINVTGFFRDREMWDFLASDVVPKILEQKGPTAPIRIWSTGCASGEEAYTVAMIFAETLGEDASRERVKIYATDIDEHALAQARQAVYTPKQLASVPDELRERYFHSTNSSVTLRGDIRRAVVFGRNDLLQDPPISRVDLLVSRNTLMYFEASAQAEILANFYFALTRRGFMMLGKAEALQSRSHLFEPYDLRRRVFVRNADIEPGRAARALRPEDEPQQAISAISLREAAFEQAQVAEIVVDPQGRIADVNQPGRVMFGLKSSDVGRALQDLEISYRPLELRSLIEEVAKDRRPRTNKEIAWPQQSGETRYIDVQLAPLVSPTGELAGLSVTFSDVSRFRALQADLEQTRRELETAYEELQSTVEELETTNEELQSTNEELETTNEELQSTNEELETMNEELHSTNEELETMNDELRERTDEALSANAFLGSILSSIHQSVIVVDRDLRVTAWSRAAAELWGLREDEVEGQSFLNLDIGLPVGDLRSPIWEALSGNEVTLIELDAHNRRGQPVRCTISFDQLYTQNDEVSGVILVMTAERREG